MHGAYGEGTPPGLAVDPVCGLTVHPQKTAHHAPSAGHEYHFCSAGCREKLVRDPEHYLNKSADRVVDAQPGPTWTSQINPTTPPAPPGASPACRPDARTSCTRTR